MANGEPARPTSGQWCQLPQARKWELSIWKKSHSFCTFGLICSRAVQCLLLHCFVMTTGHIFIEEQALVPEAHFCCWPSFSSQSCLRRQTYFQPIIQLHIFEQARTQWDRGRTVLCTLVIWAGCHFSAIKAPDFKSAVLLCLTRQSNSNYFIDMQPMIISTQKCVACE